MKKLIGFAMFWIAVGMTIMLFLEKGFFLVCCIIVLYLLSYFLFCSK